ncbi:Colicin-E7 immunity protein [compost metagenome]
MIFKEKFEYYTEHEFIAFLSELFTSPPGMSSLQKEKYRIKILDHFSDITEHPDRSDVICFPPEGSDDSVKGITQRIKEWRAANGKPGFKPA